MVLRVVTYQECLTHRGLARMLWPHNDDFELRYVVHDINVFETGLREH